MRGDFQTYKKCYYDFMKRGGFVESKHLEIMTQRYSSSSPSLSPCMLRSRPRIPFIRFAKKLESGFLHRIFKRVSSVELSKKFCNVKHTCVGTENKI